MLETQSLIDDASIARFLSGRLLGLVILLGFQVAVVRLLTPPDYALYAAIIAFAGLIQTLTSFGVPRVTAKFISGAGESLSRRAARRLALSLLAFRLATCTLALGVSAAAFVVLNSQSGRTLPWPLFYAAAAYTLATTLQIDADGLTQALQLQIASRRAAVGEPLARLALVLGLAWLGIGRNAAAILWISAAAAFCASGLLIRATVKDLSNADEKSIEEHTPNWAEVRAVALGGYSGTLSWLAVSPAVIRLIASRVLPTELFAGFSFVQTLAVSAQRYAPSFILFPLIEPAAMADAAQTGRPDRLRAALRLLVKADAIGIGAAVIGLSVGGGPILLLLTNGRYADAAPVLPWLFLAIVANASHRSYEIAAIAVGVSSALTRALGPTMIWLVAVLATAPVLGLWPLLLCPFGDALTRLWIVGRALARAGAPNVIDIRRLGLIGACCGLISLMALALAAWTHAGVMGSLGIGVTGAVVFLAVIAVVQPVGRPEIDLLAPIAPAFARFLRARGRNPQTALRVAVLTPRGPGGTGGVDRLMDSLRPLFRDRADVAVRFITTRGKGRGASVLVSLAALIRLAMASAFGLTDVIHVNLGAYAGCYRKMALIAAPRLLGAPYVLHLHGSAFEQFWIKAPPFAGSRIDGLFRDAAQVIVLGEKWRRLVISRVPEVAPRLVVLPNATPLFARARTLDASEAKILFLGELGDRKGSSLLIEGLARLQTRSPWRAVIAGDGDIETACRMVQRLHLSNRVDLPGWLGPEAVEALLAASDIFVLPSFEENLPMAVIEAFSAGLAVVATPVGAIPEILTDDATGLLVAPADVGGLARSLDALIDNPSLRKRLGKAAKSYHAQHLALGPYTDSLLHVWRKALDRRQRNQQIDSL